MSGVEQRGQSREQSWGGGTAGAFSAVYDSVCTQKGNY
jgi:hypothetical protein